MTYECAHRRPGANASRAIGLLCVTASLLIGPGFALAQDPAAAPPAAASASKSTPESLTRALQNLDNRHAELKAGKAQPASPPEWVDSRKRTLADDARDFILTPATEKEIERVRAAATEQIGLGDLTAAEQSLMAYVKLVAKEITAFNELGRYWESGAWNLPDRASYVAHLRANGVTPFDDAAIEKTRKLFEQQRKAGQFAEINRQTHPALTKLTADAAREDAVGLLAAAANGTLKPGLRKVSTTPCVPPGQGTSGGARPKVFSSGDGKSDYYPAVSKRLGETGRAHVLVRVSAEGCPLHASIVVPTGYARLDEASLALMLDSTYQPAEADGRAIEADLTIATAWDLESQ